MVGNCPKSLEYLIVNLAYLEGSVGCKVDMTRETEIYFNGFRKYSTVRFQGLYLNLRVSQVQN